MIESRTGICYNLDQVRAEIRTLRGGLVQAASETGSWIDAAGTFPLADWRTQGFIPKPRFEHIAKTYAQLADEHVICACHVHVGVEDRETAIHVMNRVRPWLPVLSALSSSSPFWMGEDTGYASYRSMIWERWPMAGMPPALESAEAYDQLVAAPLAYRGVFLGYVAVLDKDRPWHVLYRTPEPVLVPLVPEELEGVVPRVVFPTGIDRRDDLGPDLFDLYYGVADTRIAAARLRLPAVFPVQPRRFVHAARHERAAGTPDAPMSPRAAT